ncbi:CRISPR-associated endonuclease Cas2 [Mitsuokella sp. AF21-1AC]|uniref:CRISPR-associated endonuclease Cas2 n=1 Tax=Mitsuokella sp. AF21-1AC TaxID=2292235 RepID=UPI000E53991F|nr:CRISPR-associated endonuclease Cas2 [Mitsuokella sp. AF21-1AC]RGS72051.1 CRISPR-associated endonuclease Cas2 [Mitsuokella sp. AF21-1AC]
MLVLVTYDVSTQDNAGKRRLHQVAKRCEQYGQRVQNSVFECLLQPDELVLLKHQLLKIMDPEQDSIRFYNLGAKYQSKIDHYGAKHTYDPEEVLML